MIVLACMLLGLALGGVVGYLLHSWLVFVIAASSLMALGAMLGGLWSVYSTQRHIVAHPEYIDTRAEQAMRAGRWREASRWLLLGAKLANQAAREPRPDREAIAALARRWEDLARTCIHRDVGVNWEAFRAFRDQRRDQHRDQD